MPGFIDVTFCDLSENGQFTESFGTVAPASIAYGRRLGSRAEDGMTVAT